MIAPNMIMFESADNQIIPTEIPEEHTKAFVKGITWTN